jgi:hypothetical protein
MRPAKLPVIEIEIKIGIGIGSLANRFDLDPFPVPAA